MANRNTRYYGYNAHPEHAEDLEEARKLLGYRSHAELIREAVRDKIVAAKYADAFSDTKTRHIGGGRFA